MKAGFRGPGKRLAGRSKHMGQQTILAFEKTSNAKRGRLDDNDDEVSASEGGGEVQNDLIANASSSAKPQSKSAARAGDKAQEMAQRLRAFDPSSECSIDPSSDVPYSFLASTLEHAASTSKRLAMAETMCNAFRCILRKRSLDLLPAAYLASNSVAPQHEGVELGLGDATIIKALAQTTGTSEKALKQAYNEEGDLGTVASKNRSKQTTLVKPKPLSVRHVHSKLKEIAEVSGQQSQEKKKKLIESLLVNASNSETNFIVRHLQGKMRIGLSHQTVSAALAYAAAIERCDLLQHIRDDSTLAHRLAEADDAMKEVLSECPSFDKIVPAIAEHGPYELSKHCGFQLGAPLVPMLAKPTKGVNEVLSTFGSEAFTCELKYDGERAQIHILQDGSARVYSRNLENHTGKFKDVAQKAPELLREGVQDAVVDAEVVAYDKKNDKILPFQSLSHRSRKEATDGNDESEVQVHAFAFDCLYKDGRSLLKKTLNERRDALYSAIHELSGFLTFAMAKTGRDPGLIEEFLEEAIEKGTEGLIVKSLHATYEPSKRSASWLKLKKDYLSSFGDTVDLVPIGAFNGRGKRAGTFGAFLLACWDPDSEQLQTVCKLGTGFSEQALDQFTKELGEDKIDSPKSYYSYGEAPTVMPDVWVEAKQVWEVKAADLSISPVHRAASGLIDADKGIALRFPRLVRVRDDKGVEQATSAHQIAELYNNQTAVAVAAGNGKKSAKIEGGAEANNGDQAEGDSESE